EEAKVKFGVIGDFGVSGNALNGISLMMKGWSPDFIVSTGDNTYGALDTEIDYDPGLPGMQNDWEFNVGAYFGGFIQGRADGKFPLQTSPVQRFFPTVGNHDSHPDPGNGGTIDDYLDYFHGNPGGPPRLPGERGAAHDSDVSFYAVRRGPVDLFVLDADVPNRPDLLALQKSWLAAEVAASTARWKIAVFHQPPLTSGFRAAASWMLWEELGLVDAILCGHDHFYERLDYFGTPLFITGAGGQGLYSFREPPDARSLSRYNNHHSAMLVTADAYSLRLESRAFELPAQQEKLVESFVLGTPVEVDNEDVYTFFAEAGESIELRTATPPPLSQPPLTPALELFTPGGQPVAGQITTLGDGRNLRLRHVAGHSGHWQVKVRGQAPGHGPYSVRVLMTTSLPDYPAWSASLPNGLRGDNDDADDDGYHNLIEYAFQSNPMQPGADDAARWRGLRISPGLAPSTITLTFDLPSPLPPALNYQLESGASPDGPWEVVAWRPAAADWQCIAGAAVLTGAPLADSRRVAVTVGSETQRRFYRLSVSRNG
ncbi:MAG: hypothetical protein JWL81_2004, partial [Verrucomicrobiales bacterium]|nr:hypothetical protein [Verrucomicrobiales bacterium]